jgi:tetratricopeptide (TPR) repeat protein
MLFYNGFIAPAFFIMGQIDALENNFTQALENFKQAAVKDDGVYIRVRIARILKKMGRCGEALEEIETILSTAGIDMLCLREKALILNQMDHREQALDIYEKILKLDPDDQFARKEIYRLKGLNRPNKQVIRELETVTKTASRKDDPQLRGLLAQKLKDSGQHEEAAREFLIALDLDPGNPYFEKQAGYSLYNSGNHEAALRHLKEAFRKAPHDYRLRATLGKIFLETSDEESFAAFLESVHRENPANVKLVGIINKIRKQLDESKTEKDG